MTFNFRILISLVSVLLVAGSCSGDSATEDSQATETSDIQAHDDSVDGRVITGVPGGGDVEPIGPDGSGNEIFSAGAGTTLREGESRMVMVTARAFDAPGVWTLEPRDSDLVSITSPLPSLDFSAADEYTFDVEVTAGELASEFPDGMLDLVTIRLSPPAGVPESKTSSITIGVQVVQSSEPVGLNRPGMCDCFNL